jgi:hypothetical protein
MRSTATARATPAARTSPAASTPPSAPPANHPAPLARVNLTGDATPEPTPEPTARRNGRPSYAGPPTGFVDIDDIQPRRAPPAVEDLTGDGRTVEQPTQPAGRKRKVPAKKASEPKKPRKSKKAVKEELYQRMLEALLAGGHPPTAGQLGALKSDWTVAKSLQETLSGINEKLIMASAPPTAEQSAIIRTAVEAQFEQ